MRSLRCRPSPAAALLLALTLGALWASAARALPVTGQKLASRGGLLSGLLGGLVPVPALAPRPSSSAQPPSPDPCAGPQPVGDTTLSISSGGLTRTAILHVPNSAPGRMLPLIVGYHGYGSDGPHFDVDSGLSTLGDQQGFAVVYPSSHRSHWAIAGPERDVAFTADLLDQVESLACIDHRRVYATGVSIGAGMAARVGCELSARVAALVLVSGGYRALGACKPDRPVSILEIHGTSDATVPYHGKGPGEDGAVLPYVAAWAARDGCGPTPAKRTVAAHTVLYRWGGCASQTAVEHLRIYGSGHGLPNAAGREISAGQTSNISGVKNIWHFLAARTLAAPFPAAPG